ncbi:hypothetical protein XU18_5204 [Perkinsela sp. CCAP 1560/4]|nr:hypothetical protein XU18_5204 [Perkinsela sp. CCAP 1560/4]|eukprot:KNH00516.1 hypothetical protein XU18_5204 [Perkinsela sp. CCAP 1560/4]
MHACSNWSFLDKKTPSARKINDKLTTPSHKNSGTNFRLVE